MSFRQVQIMWHGFCFSFYGLRLSHHILSTPPPPPLIFLVIYWLHIIQVGVIGISWNMCVCVVRARKAMTCVSCSFCWNEALIDWVSASNFYTEQKTGRTCWFTLFILLKEKRRLVSVWMETRLAQSLPPLSFLRWVSLSQTPAPTAKLHPSAGGAFFSFDAAGQTVQFMMLLLNPAGVSWIRYCLPPREHQWIGGAWCREDEKGFGPLRKSWHTDIKYVNIIVCTDPYVTFSHCLLSLAAVQWTHNRQWSVKVPRLSLKEHLVFGEQHWTRVSLPQDVMQQHKLNRKMLTKKN